MVVQRARQEGCSAQVLGICLLLVGVDYSMSIVVVDGRWMVDLMLVAVDGGVAKQGAARIDEQTVFG